MPEEIQNKLKSFAYPILISIVGFLMTQIFFDIKDVQSKVNTFNNSINKNTQEIKGIERRVEILERKDEERQLWVRDWIERWQSAVDWADNERKK